MRPSPAHAAAAAAALASFALAAAGATDAHAQAWVGEKGGLDLSLDYNFGRSTKVVADGDTPDFDNAGTTTHQLTIGAEYVPIAKLAATVALPLAFLKYTGDPIFAHPGGGTYDDGDTHATLTDLRAGVRYQVLDEPVALSPHLAFSIPVADYETIGNTVGGRHLMAAHLGIGLGYIIGEATYLHLMYEFSLVQKYDRTPETEQHGQNRSDFAFTVGHRLLDQRLDLHLGANARLTHGGINFSEFDMLSANEQLYHDAILKEDIILVGLGAGYQVTDTVGLTLDARAFVAGSNTQNANVIALGISWSPLPRD